MDDNNRVLNDLPNSRAPDISYIPVNQDIFTKLDLEERKAMVRFCLEVRLVIP